MSRRAQSTAGWRAARPVPVPIAAPVAPSDDWPATPPPPIAIDPTPVVLPSLDEIIPVPVLGAASSDPLPIAPMNELPMNKKKLIAQLALELAKIDADHRSEATYSRKSTEEETNRTYENNNRSYDTRATDLVNRLFPEEKPKG